MKSSSLSSVSTVYRFQKHLVDFVPADGRGGDFLLLGFLRVVEEVLPSVDVPAPVITLEIIKLASLQLH